jgi:hypothetical protein
MHIAFLAVYGVLQAAAGGVNVPPLTDSASVIVVCGSDSDVRLSHVAAAAPFAAKTPTAVRNIHIGQPSYDSPASA